MFHMDLLQPKYIDTNMYTLHFINQIRFAEYRLFFMISVSLLAVPLSEQQSQGVPRIKTASGFALHRMVHNIYTSNDIYIYQVYLSILCSLNWLIADVMCNILQVTRIQFRHRTLCEISSAQGMCRAICFLADCVGSNGKIDFII